MQRFKKISKTTAVIIALFILNVVAFSVVNSRVKHTKEVVAESISNPDTHSYFKSGVNILSWSYTLLKYFRQ